MFYAVKNGVKPGVYNTWAECKENVNGYKSAIYKKFKTKVEADNFINENKHTETKTNEKKINNNLGNKKEYHIFTDGSCVNNGTIKAKAGIGIHFSENIHFDVSEPLKGTQTNNRAELTAIIRAYEIINNLKQDNCIYYLYTDSSYSIKCITEYCEKWEKNNWKKKDGEIKNLDLIQYLWKLYTENNSIIFEHVKSHTNKDDFKSKGNAKADELANIYSNL